MLRDDQGHLNVPYWQATAVASDTRIRPKSSVTLTYRFQLPNAGEEPGVTANLIYRPVHRPLAESKQWAAKDIPITSAAW